MTSHYLNQWWLVYQRIYASLGLNELIYYVKFKSLMIANTTNPENYPWPKLKYPTIQYSELKCAHFSLEWWDMGQVHCGTREIALDFTHIFPDCFIDVADHIFKCILLTENVCISTQVYSLKLNCPKIVIGSGNGLVMNRWQSITWTNDDSVYWCHRCIPQWSIRL